MAVTMKHVAERSGLSLMTVSYVLNNKTSMFRPETRDKVLKAAEELGYRPNAMARATRSGRFGCIALLQSSVPNRSVLPVGLLAGIQGAIAKHDLQLILADLPDAKLTDEAFVPRILRQLTVDGLLVNYNAGIPHRLVELIHQFDVPAVWVNSEQATDCLRPDDLQGGHLVTRRLIELGHQRIAYVDYAFGHADEVVHYSTRDRCSGYEAEMREAGLSPRVIRPAHKLVDADRFLDSRRWLKEPDRPTAVVAYNDNTARPLIYAAATAGMRVPSDLSVATFFDSPVSGMGINFSGALLPERGMGEQAVSMLLEKINRPQSQTPAKAIPTSWHDGGTVGALTT